jgi:guanylate kinase
LGSAFLVSLTVCTRVFDIELPDLDTTRSPRPGEVNGVAYHFVPRDSFRQLIDDGGFIEHAQYSGNLYGTSFAAVEDVAKSGRRCILDIDSQVGPLEPRDHLSETVDTLRV